MGSSPNTSLVYVVEDSLPSGALYCSQLNAAGYATRHFIDGHSALVAIKERMPAVILQDVRLPDINGLEVLRFVNQQDSPARVIMITSNSSIDIAVDAMRLGGFDFIEKPATKERLLNSVADAVKQLANDMEPELLDATKDSAVPRNFIGESVAMKTVFRLLDSAARSKAPVFVTGESGTGKEVCATTLHELSSRHQGPFVAINCAAIPADLFESEFFGHVKGAFSGALSDRKGAAEVAKGGTLFLDEICEMDLNLQAKLLRFLQTGSFNRVGSSETLQSDVRVICATNRNPAAEVGEGRFREDLFYRLNVIPVALPALRDRGDDILLVARHILQIKTEENGKSFTHFSAEVESIFTHYDWPGNIRELQNVIENMVVIHQGEVIDATMIPATFGNNRIPVQGAEPPQRRHEAADNSADIYIAENPQGIKPLWIIEKQAILSAIDTCDSNIPLAAAYLGVSASTIYRKIKSWENNEKATISS